MSPPLNLPSAQSTNYLPQKWNSVEASEPLGKEVLESEVGLGDPGSYCEKVKLRVQTRSPHHTHSSAGVKPMKQSLGSDEGSRTPGVIWWGQEDRVPRHRCPIC